VTLCLSTRVLSALRGSRVRKEQDLSPSKSRWAECREGLTVVTCSPRDERLRCFLALWDPSGKMINNSTPFLGLFFYDQAPKPRARFWALSAFRGSGFREVKGRGALMPRTPSCRCDMDVCHVSFRRTTQIVFVIVKRDSPFTGSLDVTWF
jgi:hypothetical protein